MYFSGTSSFLTVVASSLNQPPLTPPWTDFLTATSSAIGAIGTLGAVVVAILLALYGPRRRHRPQLRLSISMNPPDCHRVKTIAVIPGGRLEAETYYCRLRVSNVGNDEATDIEVQLLRLWVEALGSSGYSWVQDPIFIPLNLVWSHSRDRQITRPKLLPNLFHHCDLCHVLDPNGSIPPSTTERLLLVLDTEVEPYEFAPGQWPSKKRPGRYALELAVSASNSKTAFYTAFIVFQGWIDDERTMFATGLTVDLREGSFRSL